MQKHARRAFVVLAFAFFTLVSLKAQDVASITGIVTDPTGAVVPGVDVTLVNSQTSVAYKAVTDSVGSYTIVNVRPGPGYTITFARDGFNPLTVTGLYLNVNATRTQNAQLRVGASTQTVEVSASATTVTLDTTDATVGNNFQVQFLNQLPVANRDNPAALFVQQPGTTLDGAVTGARTDQSAVTLDGLDVNDIFTGSFGAIIGHAPVDSVQEFRGVTAGQLSSAGPGGGGQYELVTRSGTNRFHGALVEYHRNAAASANDWFNNDHGVPRPPLVRNQFGGNIGGPIKRDKAFFFFDWNSRRDTLNNLTERIVPTDAFRNGNIVYYTNYTSKTTSTLTPSQVAALDPQGKGFDPALLDIFKNRLPRANDLSGGCDSRYTGICGDTINTAGFRFNAPYPYTENNYVGRVDYNLTSAQKLWARLTFGRVNATQNAIQFPGDPQTFPFLDESYAWVVGHTWTLGSNKTNEASWGETVTNYNFPNSYNPTGVTQYTNGFGGTGTGGTILSGPYASAINAQSRIVPIPVVRDDFSWVKGRHTFQFGGTFKYINPDSNTILDYNSPTIGLGGNMPTLTASLRPADIANSSTARSRFDRAFAFALGRFASVSSTFNYNAKGNLLDQGTGSRYRYRFFETELYFGDTWKVSQSLTVSYGLRWQNFSVPYEKNGLESLPNLNFDQFFGARVAQSAAGKSGDTAVPLINYSLGGKANGAPGYFHPIYKNFAPRLAFAWSPGNDPKSVFSGGAGIVYDRTVVNAVQYQAAQYSYLFQASNNLPFGTPNNPVGSLQNDPRFSGFSNPPPNPVAPTALKPPYAPFVADGVPSGLANGQAFNEGVTNNLQTPYYIMFNAGFQHEFPAGLILKTMYVGRLGRRLLGQADANQLIDFPDAKSGQMMSTAFANITQQMRTTGVVTPQPWFEDIITPGFGAALCSEFGLTCANNTEMVAYLLDPLPYRGDFADTIQALASLNAYGPAFPANVGMGSQFSEFTYYTNKGFSNYHGLLVTLHKNVSHGLQFDLNYTWSHSIDNVSVIANAPAIGGYGFICDVLRPRECRGNSDFDVTQYLNGNFIYMLPFGRGQTFGSSAPRWLDEVIGGWSLSGLPVVHSGTPTFATSMAFVAGYANNAPAILTGPIANFKMHPNKGTNGTLWAFKSGNDSGVNDFVGPIGFKVGSRNNLRGPGYFNMDLGLGKSFPIVEDKLNLIFRVDAFNAFNHPNFATPDPMDNLDITETTGTFGVITDTVGTAGHTTDGVKARVLQGALRLEF
jgi:hypothetical protein